MMQIRLETSGAPGDRAFHAFADALDAIVASPAGDIEREADIREPFSANLNATEIDGVRFTWIESTPYRVRKTLPTLNQRGPLHFQFVLMRSGIGTFTQNGSSSVVGQGELALFDMTQPYAWAFSGSVSACLINVPRELFRRELGDLDRAFVTSLETGSALCLLAHEFIVRALPVMNSAGEAAKHQLRKASLALLGGALVEMQGRQPRPVSRPDTLFARCRQFIADHAQDENLCGRRIARELAISEGYLQALCRQNRTTIGREIRRTRLQLVREMLADPRFSRRCVSEIGAMFCFSSQPHLSRCFKAAYGHAPSEFRERSLLAQSTGRGQASAD